MTNCLATVVHNENLLDIAFQHFPDIAQLYDNMVVECTNETDPNLVLVLETYSANVKVEVKSSLGQVRRRVLSRALDADCDIVHFVDFDRLLFWQMSFPGELQYIVSTLSQDYFTVFGRTPAAMSSHPGIQTLTEMTCNALFTKRFGKPIDILAASRGIPRQIGLRIIEESTQDNPACIDAEWTLIADKVKEIRVNGLGYESNLLGIEKNGYDEISLRIENLRALSEYLGF